MRAAMYVRVSTEEQAKEGYSIEAQKEILMRWIADKGHDLVDEYIDDGHSSKNLKRPDMQRMLKDIPTRKFDIIVFWRMNRLTRSVKDKVYLFEMFEKFGVSLKSMTEEIDTTTASGRMITNLLVSVAQGEREQTSENVHATMYERTMKGLRNGAVAPYGYDLVEGQLAINEIEAAVVVRIFEYYLNNKSVTYIAKQFNKEGIPKGSLNKWAPFTVYYILCNPTYTGKLRWNYRKLSGARTHNEVIVDGKHEPIISEAVFEKSRKFREQRRTEGRRITSDYAFTSTLHCARCGHRMIGGSRTYPRGKQRFYRCLGRFHYGICDMPVIIEEAIEEAFFEKLEDIKSIERFFDVKVDDQERDQMIEHLQKELDAIHKRKKKWQFAYANDVITLEELKSNTEEERSREKFIVEELKKSPAKERFHRTKEDIIEELLLLPQLWHQVDSETPKKMFMTDIFEKISINTESVASSKVGRGFRPIVQIVEVIVKD